ncbi:MAG: hypothetical protein L0Y79_12795 [Chlorobi bacterium]|nr:hypothetical protein [Chlorobiota bacterium]MCI0716729.1 hypothetical protein [Chlorobiota bacterium]
MKRAFVILTLLIAFNFTAPNNQTLIVTIRHQIEFVQENKLRDLTDNEILKNKVVLFLRLQMLAIRVSVVNLSYGFNTS